MIASLKRTYLDLFYEYPALVRLAIVTGAGQLALALLNSYALPIYLKSINVPAIGIGLVSFTFLASEMLLKFPFGRLSDRVGRKPFVLFGPLVICLNPLFYIWLPARLWALAVPIRALDGAGAAALWPPLYAMVGDLVRSARRTAAMSVMNAVYAAGGGAAMMAGLGISVIVGDKGSFYVASGLLLLTALVAHFGLPKVIPEHEPAIEAAADAGPVLAKAAVAPNGIENNHMHYPLWLVLCITFFMSFGVLSLPPYIMLYLKGTLHFSQWQIMWMLAGLAVPIAILGMPIGNAADHWGKEPAVRIALSIAALSMWILPSCHTLPTLLPAALVLVLAYMACTPAWLAIISDLAPTCRRGHIMSLVATAEGAGAALGPIMGGLLWGGMAQYLDKPVFSLLKHVGNNYFVTEHPGHIFYGSAFILSLCAILAIAMLRAKRK
jgi:MFS family permease